MDQILKSLLLSDSPDALKRQLAHKIAGAGPQTEDTVLVKSMFEITTNFILDAELQFSADLCKKIYIKWAKCHVKSLHEFFNADFIGHLLEGKFRHGVNAVWLLHETFILLRGTDHHDHLTRVVEAKTVAFVRDHPQHDMLTAFCRFLFDFKACIPKEEHTSTFCVAMVHAVSAFSAPTSPDNLKQFVVNVSNVIGAFMNHIWSHSGSHCILHCLKAIFTLISYMDDTGTEPCIALGGLVTHIPLNLIEKVVKTTVADTTIADANMIAALLRVIDWLNWPIANNVDQWILAFLRELAVAHKYTILIKVTEHRIEQVYCTLHHSIVRERGMAVLSHMLLSFQHSPEAFHKIVHRVTETVHIIRAEGGPETTVFLDRFSELMHCLMTLHPGFPELYDKVVDSIKDYQKPSSEMIRLRLTQSKWSFQQKAADGIVFASRFAKKSETGKTGLTNLGNTCYMNSVIQALYMCDGLRREAFRAPISPQQPLLVKLQYVFAHLAMTQRAAYSPTAFLKASRPPWFTAGHQQDCSEFLRYLLDQLHEQENNIIRKHSKASTTPSPTGAGRSPSRPNPGATCGQETLIRRTFGGQMQTTYQCLRCQTASSRTEDFTDIPLAFPDQEGSCGGGMGGRQGDGGSQGGKAALVGGAMSVSPGAAGPGDPGGRGDSLQLEDMLGYYLKPELLQGDNRYQCETCCGLQEAERSLHITQSPDVLILTLLRFAYNTKTHSRSKIFTDVACPRTIRVPVTCNPSPHQLPPGSKSTFYLSQASVKVENYGLCSVVVHSGASSECGHYYCYARHSTPATPCDMEDSDQAEDHLTDNWYLFNDSRVTFSSYSSFSNVSKKFAKDTIYLLVYKRITEGSAQQDPVEPPLRKDLRESVERDNKLYIQEQELEGRARAMQKTATAAAASSSWYHNWKDDDQNGPPGSCGGGGGGGGGGLGGLDTTGSRFIF